MTEPDSALSIENLTVSYRRKGTWSAAISNVSLAIAPGEAVGLVGESGCGKSTIAMAAMRYLPRNGRIDSGSVRLEGHDLASLDQRALSGLRGNRMAIVYQNPASALNPSIPVGRQVAEVFERHFALSSRDARQEAVDMLGRVRIPDPERVARLYPYQLSGGMQQRVVIAMAIAPDPALLILDEPTTALDTTVQAEILDLFRDLRTVSRAGLLFISHNLGVVSSICERMAVMYAGEIVEQGPVDALFDRPAHPYTAALLACIPRFGQHKSGTPLATIAGHVPEAASRATGCRFHDRCPVGETRCTAGAIPLRPIDDGRERESRCLYPERSRHILDGRASAYEPDEPAAGLPDRDRGGKRDMDFTTVNISQRYGPVTILDDVSLSVEAGQTLGLVGESGSGKTTWARIATGLLKPSDGEVRLGGETLAAYTAGRPRSALRAVQMVFQSPDTTLNPSKTISAILSRPLRLLSRLTRAQASARVPDLLGEVQLRPTQATVRPDALSGGQRQRVAIARAFAGDPDVVILDEPTSALDVSVQAAVLNLLNRLQRRHEVAYVLISHDLSVVRYMSDRIAVLYLGQIMEIGPTERVFHPPHHPYTRALINAIPGAEEALDTDQEPSAAWRLSGANPGPAARPAGCPFHTRCPVAMDVCSTEPPPWQDGADGHRIRCWHGPDVLSNPPPAVHLTGQDTQVPIVPRKSERMG